MEFLLNELSVHGQFSSAVEFFQSVESIMFIREAIERSGNDLYCNRSLTTARVTSDAFMQQVIQSMPKDKQSAWITWITKKGPYWTDKRTHDSNEWLECNGKDLITDSAIGEAAFCKFHGLDHDTVSFTPSNWTEPSITVRWCKDGHEDRVVAIANHTDRASVDVRLAELPKPFNSWETLKDHAVRVCSRLTFTEDSFAPFAGVPFVKGAATQLLIRLQVLDRLKGSFDKDGCLTGEGKRLYQEHFTGSKAWFSDSSETEKNEFKSALTFAHPQRKGDYLICTWHGKVKTPQLRIHFSWPVTVNKPLFVVYVGPKITKR